MASDTVVATGDGLYPIRTVASLTGVQPITLRAWERRYGLVQPQRTDGGHRLYTQGDIDSINRVVELRHAGVPLRRMQARLGSLPTNTALAEPALYGPWRAYHRRMAAAIARFDEEALEDAYNEALSLYAVDTVTQRLLMPLLEALGSRWQTSAGGIAEEHFFGVFLRNKLGARFHHRTRGVSGPRLLLACLPGEQHEIGLLLFALAAHERGYRLVLLGADMPLTKLGHTARCSRSDALVLSGSMVTDPDNLDVSLGELVRDAGVPVFVGGRVSVDYHDQVARAGALPVGKAIQAGLRHIDSVLPGSRVGPNMP